MLHGENALTIKFEKIDLGVTKYIVWSNNNNDNKRN